MRTERKTPERLWKEMVLRTVMRAAIPIDDPKSRGAIQYANEMAEFMEQFGVEIRASSRHSKDRIKLAIAYMDQNDPPLGL